MPGRGLRRWGCVVEHIQLPCATGDPAGITEVELTAARAGATRLQLSAGKRALVLGTLPLQVAPSVLAQVRTPDGQCWGATFSTPLASLGWRPPGLPAARSQAWAGGAADAGR